MGAVFLKPFAYFSQKRVVHAKNEGRPILLVHGYLHNATAWVYQKQRLAEEGFGPIYVLNLKKPFASIVAHAEQLKEKALEIQQETGRSDLILIGHSMGGLVCSWYATQLAPRGKVTDLITIGSPLRGTTLAKVGLGSNAREMERDSLFLYELQKAIQKSRSTRFYHIASMTDQTFLQLLRFYQAIQKDRPFLMI
jgi:triacylglycerol esterase/lipase EstA (alpha/beta hydrolase family)